MLAIILIFIFFHLVDQRMGYVEIILGPWSHLVGTINFRWEKYLILFVHSHI